MSVTVRFGADEYDLKGSWAASQEFDQKIGDPLQMALKLNQEGNAGFTSRSIVKAIWVGMKHAGHKLTEGEVGELCAKHGIINYLQAANAYLIMLVTGGPEEAEEEGEDSKKK